MSLNVNLLLSDKIDELAPCTIVILLVRSESVRQDGISWNRTQDLVMRAIVLPQQLQREDQLVYMCMNARVSLPKKDAKLSVTSFQSLLPVIEGEVGIFQRLWQIREYKREHLGGSQ